MNRFVDTHQNTAWWRSHRATSLCTTGSARRHRSGRGGKRVAWATPVWVGTALSQLQPDQKAHGQHHDDRMPVKARPQPALILVPAQLLFGLLMPLLDGVPAMGVVDQLLQRGRSRQVAPIILVFLGLPTRSALPEHPADTGCALRRDPPGAHGYALLAPPSLAPVPPADRTPLAPGHGGQHLVAPLGVGGIPTFWAHLKVGSHGHHIAC